MRAYHIRICLTPKLDKSRSHPDPSGTTFTPSSLWQHLPSHSQRRVARRGLQVSDYKGSEDYRYGPLRLEWIDFENMSFAQAAQGPVIASFSQNTRTKSGQTELPEGIVRLFRDASSPVAEEGRGGPSASTDASNPLDSESKRMLFDGTDADGVTVGVLAVPSWMSASDFLMFVAPAQEGISHLRMIRDCAPDRSVVLIKFRKEEQAIEFAEAYNGRLFNSMESETCHVVRVASVSVDNDDSLSLSIARLGSQAPAYELPTCPVCLERMDSAVTGLVTVPCSHTFHCSCLSKWGGGRCPVCRYSQTLRTSHPTSSSTRSSVPIPFADPSLPALSRCRECSSTTNLWICLICGNIGCGRYGQAHAHAHYTSTAHLYALELETQRTWDYASDQYVHRLIQNKADGKLVELPSASMASGVAPEARGGPTAADALTAEKIEAIGIEYSYLLSSQLDTQRTYYEDQARALQAQIDSLQATMAKFEDTATRLDTSQIEASRAVQEAEATRRERVKAEAKADKLTELARRLERELKEERAVSAGLLENLEFARKRAEEAERAKAEFQIRVQELEDQVRDVMFFLEARDKIESGDGPAAEAAGGSVEIASPPNQGPGKKKKKR